MPIVSYTPLLLVNVYLSLTHSRDEKIKYGTGFSIPNRLITDDFLRSPRTSENAFDCPLGNGEGAGKFFLLHHAFAQIAAFWILFFALFKWIGYNGHRNRCVYISIITRLAFGVALVSLPATIADEDLQSNYASSLMLLPSIVLALTFSKLMNLLPFTVGTSTV